MAGTAMFHALASGKIKAGSTQNGVMCHQDMLPTILAAAGDPNINQKLLDGYTAGDKTFNVCIDGNEHAALAHR